jgi:hypothetical protein
MLAMEGWTECEYCIRWSFEDGISHSRGIITALSVDRPLHGRRWFHFSYTLGEQRPGAGYRTVIELKIVGVL